MGAALRVNGRLQRIDEEPCPPIYRSDFFNKHSHVAVEQSDQLEAIEAKAFLDFVAYQWVVENDEPGDG